jgi:hypothetical protein
MAIKTISRASVSVEFLEYLRQVYETFIHQEKQHAAEYPSGAAKYLKMRASAHAHILSVLRVGHSDNRSGLEYEMTRLRVLPYQEFTTTIRKGKKYLVGVTKPIVIEGDGCDRKYYLGSYAVYLSLDAIANCCPDDFQFIPLKQPYSHARHPHHKVDYEMDSTVHPLDKEPRTCWGGFGNPVRLLLDIPDIPELFRLLYLYLSRYNPSSPLVHGGIKNLDFDTNEIKEPA